MEQENNREEITKERARVDSLAEDKRNYQRNFEYDIKLDEVKVERNNFMQAIIQTRKA